ncbi:hypothetical protein DRW41_13730 [Neobacillus piezotolerans]|uniref:RDD family protein n=1 Tax=Neobacillus piezotolerans TaxID=2259171 RepID=A0A3D8GQ62_9BACI|nr:RDD family protein [Neobacillus piezotolerans]RDU36578.1 hypothetical protein DRW41_13730 [Neobacillus piezotolerans]
MYCPNCNTLNDDSARYCSKCGEYLEKKALEVCPDCGTERQNGDEFCNICGYKFADGPTPAQTAPVTGSFDAIGDTNGLNSGNGGGFQSSPSHNYGSYNAANNREGNVRYANFGERLVALIIDSVILGVAGFFLGMVFVAFDNEGITNFLSFIIGIAYKAGMEGSSNQATLGKMAMGIKVIGPDGGRISYGRAIGRYFATFLSTIILGIGYLMALFTKEKRTLHDFIAGTYVIKK